MIVLNLKTYPECLGLNLEKYLVAIQNCEDSSNIFVAPNIVDLAIAKKNFPDLQIISQSVSPKKSGSSTGAITPELLLEHKINISIFNHSENRRDMSNIVDEIREIQDRGIKLIVCCETYLEAIEISKGEPFAIAYEPPELIGSGISVTTTPEPVLEFTSQIASSIIPLVGAGVTTSGDVRKSVELGAKGVLLASAFVKAVSLKDKINDLIQGLNP